MEESLRGDGGRGGRGSSGIAEVGFNTTGPGRSVGSDMGFGP